MSQLQNQQLFYAQPGVAVIEPRPMPTPGPAQLLVCTRTTLISPGTERAHFLGLPNTPQQYPISAGYSNIGEVIGMGRDVQNWQVGERVASSANHAAYVLVDANTGHKVPEGLVDEEAVFFNLASIGLQGVRKARIELGEPVAVIGAGLIGLMALQHARLQGALPAISIDQDASRLDYARQSGADYGLTTGDDLPAQLAQLTDGQGASVVLEATGHPDAILTALACTRPFGRVVLLGSTRGETDHVNFYRDVHVKGLTLIGAHDFARPRHESSPAFWTQYDDRRVVLALLARGRLNVRPYITHRFAWSDAPQAYDLLKSWTKSALGMVLDWTSAP